MLIRDAGGPIGLEAEMLAVLEPVGNLLDGGLFQVVGQGDLAGGRSGAGEDVAAGVGDTT